MSEDQRVEEMEELQTLFMEGVCTDDESVGMAIIDDALSRGANFIDDEVEPLFYAASGRRARVLAYLIERGATLAGEWPNNRRRSPDGAHGDTALHAAAENGDCGCLQVLLAADGGAFLNRFDLSSCGRTPLIAAAENGHIEAVRMLIQAGTDVNAHDELMIGDTAIKRAVEERHLEIVRMLLDGGADPTIPGWMQLTAIHRAQLGGEETREMLAMIRAHLRVSDEEWSRLLISTQG